MDCIKQEAHDNAIVEINDILRENDRTRIGKTPFKWCLDMNRLIDLCSPLLKEMVTPNNGTFTMMDVYMGLGLGVGGLDVNLMIMLEDLGNPMIRVTLHLDERAIPEHGVDEFGMSWE
ncbi:hypothetical protein V8G54_014176 [Vigna mungo]|uniref:Uncharacterized protein n=1 Tax=Vigna mungo TaxID=3915 RepID=A0AAQ3RZ09_VIGMU